MSPIFAFSTRVTPPAKCEAFWSKTRPSTSSVSSIVPLQRRGGGGGGGGGGGRGKRVDRGRKRIGGQEKDKMKKEERKQILSRGKLSGLPTRVSLQF